MSKYIVLFANKELTEVFDYSENLLPKAQLRARLNGFQILITDAFSRQELESLSYQKLLKLKNLCPQIQLKPELN